MMTQEQWQKVRDMEEIPLYIWFEYYREKGGLIDNLGMFESNFFNILARQPMVISKEGRPLALNFDTAVNRLYDYYYDKFPE